MPTMLPADREVAKRAIRSFSLGLAVFLSGVVTGCQEPTPDPRRFVPPASTATAALTTALESWVKGRPPGRIESKPVGIQVVDSLRKPGQRLTSFDILGEVPDEHYRCFKVKLSLENPEDQPLVRFVVLGIDPLWVFRAEDLEMMTHWEHHATDDADPKEKQ
jgi:hypothetical protein